ncbi:SWIM zinc finger family protein [Aquimarina aggregata]|uniref:SWIM zinc finger family protein n=1 Tax=Aquimarina aggregata TaxID=1642818 RepID=UPI0024924827|nr:SWIM zinc finger family protein [Aquimarina aggregata]
MIIPLDQFEILIDSKILKRGADYYEDGAVIEFEEISTGEYEAIVLGTEEYRVQFRVSENTIVEHHCDCPYDLGPVCKHLVAAIFYLEQDRLIINHQTSSAQKTEKKTVSVSKQVKNVLKQISHSELISFIEKQSKTDKKFRNYFLSAFSYLHQGQSKDFYKKQIHNALQAAKGRDGYISWSETKYIHSTITPFLENAEESLNKGGFENAFYISTALLEEMTEAFEYADDSGGDISYFIDASIELLFNIATEDIPKPLNDEIFDYCLSEFEKEAFSDITLLRIASKLIKNEKEADVIIQYLDSVQDTYEIERAQTFQLELVRKFKGIDEAEKFIEKYIANPSIRKEEIEKPFENRNYKRVKELSEYGILKDQNDKPGLLGQWYDWLLKIAMVEQNVPKIIEFARYRFLHSFGGSQNYYQILKNTVPKKDWHRFLEDIIKEITPNTHWTYSPLIRKIYIEEKWWDRLFLMLKENTSLQNIEENELYLSEDYASELVQLYRERLEKYVENYVGRKYYKTACRYLRRMKKLGGKDQADSLIKFFKEKYPQRRALMDELSKV